MSDKGSNIMESSKMEAQDNINASRQLSETPFMTRLSSTYANELNMLVKGHEMLKVHSKSKAVNKLIQLSSDHMSIKYCPPSAVQCTSRKKKKVIPIQDIKEVRKGWRSDRFSAIKKRFDTRKSRNKKIKKFEESRSLSIVFGSAHNTLDLQAESQVVRDMWATILELLIKRLKHLELNRHHDAWVRAHFEQADVNNDGSLNLDECYQLLKNMNVIFPRKYVKIIFDVANSRRNLHGDEVLDKDEFVHFYNQISQRSDIIEIMKSFSADAEAFFDASELKDFYEAMQEKQVPLAECEALITKFEPDESKHKEKVIGVEGFTALLQSKSHQLFKPQNTRVYHDMKQPLANYYIASSHNTYLMADQLSGPSSCEAYRRALQKGCRCVEIDIWDGPDDEPIVYHGHTFTSKILFKDVVVTVMRYAFVSSKYPVILSLENHCSVKQQQIMAQYLKKICGDALYVPTDWDKLKNLPSPHDLQGKIIIKGKRLRSAEPDEDEVSDEDESAEIDESNTASPASTRKSGGQTTPSPASTRKSGGQTTPSPNSIRRTHPPDDTDKTASKEKKKKIKLSKEMSNITFLKSVHFNSFAHSQLNYKCAEMSSLVEKKSLRLVKKEPKQFVAHSQRFLSRIYPGGKRTDSSNYDPVDLWNVGCQIVALNYQTCDKIMPFNDGKFRDNGGCGYLLRPDYINSEKFHFDPFGTPPNEYGKLIQITVISGQQIPKASYGHKGEIIDPYIKVYIKGLACDEQQWQTRYVNNNGFNPMWQESYIFTVRAPELALVRFVIMDKDLRSSDDFIAQYVIPFTCMQVGYHHIHEFVSETGDLVPGCSIFIRVGIKPLPVVGTKF